MFYCCMYSNGGIHFGNSSIIILINPAKYILIEYFVSRWFSFLNEVSIEE